MRRGSSIRANVASASTGKPASLGDQDLAQNPIAKAGPEDGFGAFQRFVQEAADVRRVETRLRVARRIGDRILGAVEEAPSRLMTRECDTSLAYLGLAHSSEPALELPDLIGKA